MEFFFLFLSAAYIMRLSPSKHLRLELVTVFDVSKWSAYIRKPHG